MVIKNRLSCSKVVRKDNKPEIVIVNSIKDVRHDLWDELAAIQSFFLQYKYLEAFEASAPDNISFRYAMLKSSDKYCGVAYIQLVNIEGESMSNFLQSSSINEKQFGIPKKINQYADCLKMRMLVCGNVFISGEHGFAYDKKTLDGMSAFMQLNKIIELIIKQEQKIDPISVALVKDFYSTSAFSSSVLKNKKKYGNVKVDPTMILEMDPKWKKFEDYLASLTSKYRVRAKSILRSGNPLVSKDFNVTDIVKYKEDILKYYIDLHDKAKFKPAAYTIETFAALKKNFKNNFIFTGYFIDDKLVAFKSYFIVGDNNIEAHFVGYDNSLNKKHELYQNILYAYVKDAIQIGSPKIYFGRTALEIKSNIGARPYELICYMKHVNPVYNFILKPFVKNLQPKDWIMRNPFKKPS